jgi:hypothetical protein
MMRPGRRKAEKLKEHMKGQAGTSYRVGKGLGMRAANILVDLDIRSLGELLAEP